jgi:hypothetical protein
MTMPLVILAIGAIFAGLIGFARSCSAAANCATGSSR